MSTIAIKVVELFPFKLFLMLYGELLLSYNFSSSSAQYNFKSASSPNAKNVWARASVVTRDFTADFRTEISTSPVFSSPKAKAVFFYFHEMILFL